MKILSAIAFALVLSVDSFSAAFALGFRPHSQADAWRFGGLAAASSGSMAAMGFFFGSVIAERFADYDHWIAFLLLFAVGAHMIFEALGKIRSGDDEAPPPDDGGFHGIGRLLLVSVITSLDALGVGMGLGIAEKPWLLYSAAIAISALIWTQVGMAAARRLSANFGPKCEILGGLVLIALAFPMLRI